MQTSLHSLLQARPAPALARFVRCYGLRTGRIAASSPIVQPVHARAACILEFNTGDRSRVRYTRGGLEKTSPRSVLIGMQTHRRATLHMSGNIDSFAILFQPTGLYQLFGTCMAEVTDRDFEAQAVLGPAILELEMRLEDCRTFAQRIATANRFLLERVSAIGRHDGVSAATDRMLRNPGATSVAALASMTGLSLRQLERRFAAQVGMSPKLFACVVRFEAVMDRMTRLAGASWSDTAYRFGYHDQMHMVHDIQRFTGETPTKNLDVFREFFGEALNELRVSDDPTHILRNSRLVL